MDANGRECVILSVRREGSPLRLAAAFALRRSFASLRMTDSLPLSLRSAVGQTPHYFFKVHKYPSVGPAAKRPSDGKQALRP